MTTKERFHHSIPAAALGMFVAAALVHCDAGITEGGDATSTTSSTAAAGGADATTTTAGGAGSTQACGDATCGANELCDYDYDSCSSAPPETHCDPIASQCVPRPASCTEDEGPVVCGCDGQLYDSACHAAAAGSDIGADVCEKDAGPTGTFGCGPFFCDASVSYCRHGIGDACDRSYACEPLPTACGAQADCSCFDLGSSETCQPSEGNLVTGVQIDEVLL